MQNAHPHRRETHAWPVHQTLAAALWPAEAEWHDEQQRGSTDHREPAGAGPAAQARREAPGPHQGTAKPPRPEKPVRPDRAEL